MKRLAWCGLRMSLLFALLGPGIGALPVLVSAARIAPDVQTWAPRAGLVVVVAYAAAALPAAATGLAVPFLLQLLPRSVRSKTWIQTALAVAFGFAVCLVWFDQFGPSVSLSLASLGGLAAGVCVPLASWLKVGPNNSSKPTPLRGAA